ncbi:MAG: hypothetical protein WC117_07155 [Sphaerochaetaceae bacterium]|nr:hypothetical protein [Sphaerochaetaceae bacterium]MDD3163897.1 hypothetical protein [Sphaerochaetaceae bacterium]
MKRRTLIMLVSAIMILPMLCSCVIDGNKDRNVKLINNTGAPITVSYFLESSVKVTIPANSSITVKISDTYSAMDFTAYGDFVYEHQDNVSLTVSNPSCTFGPNQTCAQIVNSTGGSITLWDMTYTKNEIKHTDSFAGDGRTFADGATYSLSKISSFVGIDCTLRYKKGESTTIYTKDFTFPAVGSYVTVTIN